MKKSYVSTVHRYISGFLAITIMLVGIIWILRDFRDLRRGLQEHREEYSRFCRNVLVDQLNRAVNFIRFQQQVERERIERVLISKVGEVSSMINHARRLHEKEEGTVRTQERVLEVLRNLRWEGGHGYFFVIGLDGTSLAHPKDPIGKNVIDYQDSFDRSFIREMIEKTKAAADKTAFVSYLWNKPDESPHANRYMKLACIRRLEPWGWIIGTGKYLDDVAGSTRRIMKRRLAQVRFSGGDGYIYVIGGDGRMLVHALRPDLVGQSVLEMKDASGDKFIPRLMEIARSSPDGDFIEYSWIKPSTGLPERKITYVKYLSDLDWYVASGFYWDDFANIVRHQAHAMKTGFVVKGVSLAVILFLLMLVAYFASRRVARLTLKDFSLLSSVFSAAASQARPIDVGQIEFSEFRPMAESANSMIDVRRQAEAALQAYQDSLEETITRRTADLARTNRELLGEINERRRAEDALHESRELLASTIDSLDGQLLVIDRQMRIVLCNRKAKMLLRETFGPDDKCYKVFYGASAPCGNCPPKLTFGDGKVRVCEERDEKTGSFSERRITPIVKPDGSIPLVIEYTYDITERKKAEGELLGLRKLLGDIIDSMPSILVGIDTEGRVTQWNAEAWRRTGLDSEHAKGRKLSEIIPELANEMDGIYETILTRAVLHNEKVARTVDGQTRYEDITVYPLMANGVQGAVIRIDDVTRRVNMEDIMIQSEKMLSVGGLAAGMAHEINNPLAGILQNVQVIENRLCRELPRNEEAAERCGIKMTDILAYVKRRGIADMLLAVMDSGRRAARIVENMLSFSRKSDSRYSSHDLRLLLDKTVALAFNDYDLKKKYDFRKIRFERDYAEDMPLVPCEGATIQQVLLNILKNAAYAMSCNAAGTEPCIGLYAGVQADMAVIRISDNGPGMDENTRKRIFEPFFTTKEIGDGTGLGLSVSYFIITERHGGKLSVDSRPGRGSAFTIKIPLSRPRTGDVGEERGE